MITARMTANSEELNNNSNGALNDVYQRLRSESRTSVSSASSCHSDSSEEIDVTIRSEESVTSEEQSDVRRCRSMSDGANSGAPSEEIFPSLPDSVLEKLGLLGDGPRERLSENDLEQKFTSLALAFSIDSVTIKDRCERQRRYRDQTELNLSVEIDRLIEKINRIQPFCVNAETTELLTGLLAQVDLVMKATSLATISAERYGAVQHEDRLAESVALMISHVTLLKQQRDSAKRQLQYTKRVLQDTNSNDISATKQKASSVSSLNGNNKRMDRRRASIATITQPQLVNSPPLNNHKRITRRTSDLSLRTSALLRSSRPSRLELGVDLVKIKEGMVENEPPATEEEIKPQNNIECDCQEPESPALVEPSEPESNVDISLLPFRQRLVHRAKKVRRNIETKYDKWSNDGTLHEIFCFGALVCFSFSIITMSNILIEMEFAKRGVTASKSSWYFSSWYDFSGPVTMTNYQFGSVTT